MLMLLLFFTGLFAGTVDAIAGGGGLISIPVLLSLGIPPQLAFGTNKLQSTIGTFVAATRYHRQGLTSLRMVYVGIFSGMAGAILGSVAAQLINSDVLRKIIPVLLLLILVYTLLSPRFGFKDNQPKMKATYFYLIFGFVLGLYDGFFGPGVGSFWVFLLTFFMGYNLIKATAYTKIFNLNSNVIATICFAIGSNIDYKIALCMAAGQLIGGRLGANLAINKGARLIRPMFLCIVTVTTMSLIYKAYSHSAIFSELTRQYGLLPPILIGVCLLLAVIAIYFRASFRSKAVSS